MLWRVRDIAPSRVEQLQKEGDKHAKSADVAAKVAAALKAKSGDKAAAAAALTSNTGPNSSKTRWKGYEIHPAPRLPRAKSRPVFLNR